MGADLLVAVGAVVLLALVGWPLFRSCRRTPVGALALLGGVWALGEAAALPTWQIVGLRLSVMDAANLIVLAAAIARFANETRRRVHVIWFVGVSMYVLALVRGLLRTESTAQLEFSNHLLILTGILYGVTFTRTELSWPKLSRTVQGLAAVFLGILLGLQIGVFGDGTATTLSAASAFVVALAFFAVLIDPWSSIGSSKAVRIAWMILLGGGVLVLQHRTVWIALVVGLLLYALLSARTAVVVVSVVLSALALVAVMDSLGVRGSRQSFAGESFITELQTAADSDTTFEWRIERWRATLETNAARGRDSVIFGAGYRQDWVEFGPQVDRREPPHSQYVEIAVRFGIVGLAAWTWLYGTSLRRLRASLRAAEGSARAAPTFLYLVLGMQLIWSVSYSLSMIQPILLGLAIGVTSKSPSVRQILFDPSSTENNAWSPSGADRGNVRARRGGRRHIGGMH